MTPAASGMAIHRKSSTYWSDFASRNSGRFGCMQYIVWALVLVLVVLHQDNWFWDRRPAGVRLHADRSVLPRLHLDCGRHRLVLGHKVLLAS